MLDRYTTDLTKAALLLHTIKTDLDRLDQVLELQRHLIRQLTRLERRAKRVQRAAANMRQTLSTMRPPRDQAKALKLRIKECPELLEKIRRQMFVWRCFGDGIAFAYQSKYALKHLYYDRDYNVKQTAGFLSGKIGFRKEWRFVRLGIKMAVPVVLADITNVIRYGDVCALGGADPVPIEVKSGKSRNDRTDRQIADLDTLTSFFVNDGASSFRGMPNVQRVEMRSPEVNYLAEVNACIAESRTNGTSSVELEAGLRYFAIRETDADAFDRHLRPYINRHTTFTMLTPDADWLPAEPFTLSFDAANLIDFIHGRVVVVVLIDLLILKSLFLQMGVHCVMLMDGTYSMQLCRNPKNLSEGVVRVSDLMFARVSAEFQSLTWFAKEQASALEPKDLTHLSREEVESLPGGGWTPPPEWHTVKDYFDSEATGNTSRNSSPATEQDL